MQSSNALFFVLFVLGSSQSTPTHQVSRMINTPGNAETDNFVCSLCSKVFSNHYNLKVHQKIHTGEKPYKCEFCGKSFVQKTNLKMHVRTHTGEKPYKCGLCDKSYAQGTSLKQHLANCHTCVNDSVMICEICCHVFQSQSDLLEHIKVHDQF